MKHINWLITMFGFVFFQATAQQPVVIDKGVFKEYKAGFYENNIMKETGKKQTDISATKPEIYFSIDLTDADLPDSLESFTKYWHNEPLSQGASGTCWCYATVSFIESEIYRQTNQQIKLSEMYIVYWEYVERARRFVQERGNSSFAQGSEANAVIRMMKMYGVVTLSDYPGKKKDEPFHNHTELFEEMNTYLQTVKKNNTWNEDSVVKDIKLILNSYMGIPPTEVAITGREVTPQEYLTDVLKLNVMDYFSFMSTKEKPYNQRAELEEEDNWWHSDDYYNVSLDDYMDIIINAIENGYTISICGDITEAGYDKYKQAAVVPSFDIPSEYINEDSRQFRLSNRTTIDDHCVHLIGYMQKNGNYWFLVKDSGSHAFDGKHKGYQYFHEDYVKLKMMNILVHKDAAKKTLDKIIK